MPKAKMNTAKSNKEEPIYTWVFSSSMPRAGGQTINYVARMNQDGSLSCNCPGWVFAKKGQPRACKHTKKVEEESKGVMASWKNGQPLPTLNLSPQAPVQQGSTVSDKSTKDIKIKYGRVLDLED